MHHKEFAHILSRFLAHQQLLNTYAEKIFRNLEYLPGHQLETNQNVTVFKWIADSQYNNFHGSVQGGALATLLDVSTTLALLKQNQAKTVSVEMNMSYLNPVPLNKPVFVRAEGLKFGKSLCYSQMEVYDEQLKTLFTGRHVKAVVKGSFLE